ncbi:MAG: hypothetical protein JWQ42_471 [Edaphobacter sp.]|jgi:hypothetical protein|nr:hypothetical protein [Edaphobacter sp.]
MRNPAKPASDLPEKKAPTEDKEDKQALPELAPEDFYYEGPYLVFTAAYHLKRGYCCNSNCRHCPYK